MLFRSPLDLGMLGDLTDLKYDESDKSVKMYMTLNENIMSVEAMKENSANMKKMFKLGMSGDSHLFHCICSQVVHESAGAHDFVSFICFPPFESSKSFLPTDFIRLRV